jgi:hypothetical protein
VLKERFQNDKTISRIPLRALVNWRRKAGRRRRKWRRRYRYDEPSWVRPSPGFWRIWHVPTLDRRPVQLQSSYG